MKTLFTALILLVGFTSQAQTKITGKVTDDKGEAVPGANIVIVDTYDGTSSAIDGSFSFTTEEKGEHTLRVTFVGYKMFQLSVVLDGKALALDIKLKEEINQLEAVVISAGSFTAGEEKRRTILKAVDIATTAGATADIAGALNTLPGTQKVGESGRLFVRGGDGNEARTFIDGMLVLDAYGTSAPNTPSRGRFLPFMFKGTSFSTGGYSAEYGQALSSALVLSSKDKAELNQTDIGLLSVGADVAHTQVWDRGSVSGKIQYTNIRPYFGLINQRVDWKVAPASFEGSTAFRQQVGKGGMFKFFGNFNRTDFSLYNHDIADPSLKQLYELDNTYGYGNASYQHVLGKQWMLRGGLSYTLNENDAKVEMLPMGQTEHGVHAKVVAEYSASDKVEIHFGNELIDRTYEASRWNPEINAPQSLEFHETISASFAEAELYASNQLVTKLGVRTESNNLTNRFTVDPRASIAYKPGGKGQFSFAYGTFRQAAKNELLRFNTTLNPERAEHFILNYQVISDRRTFRVETYYKNYKDLVKYVNGNPYDLTNAGNGYARGVEVFWRDNQSLKNVDYWISYSFLDTERDYLNFPAATAPAFASKHNFSIVYKHFIQKIKSQIGVTYSYSSGRAYFNPNAEKFHSDRALSYQDLSANISYLPKSWLIIHASCTNLLGRDNIFGYEYATSPNASGVYTGRAIRQAAPRFLFLGVFVTISKNKSVNQLPNL
jgi:CarboxypepD_reg-like domain/TonB-dependent Receptor Plug Domain